MQLDIPHFLFKLRWFQDPTRSQSSFKTFFVRCFFFCSLRAFVYYNFPPKLLKLWKTAFRNFSQKSISFLFLFFSFLFFLKQFFWLTILLFFKIFHELLFFTLRNFIFCPSSKHSQGKTHFRIENLANELWETRSEKNWRTLFKK